MKSPFTQKVNSLPSVLKNEYASELSLVCCKFLPFVLLFLIQANLDSSAFLTGVMVLVLVVEVEVAAVAAVALYHDFPSTSVFTSPVFFLSLINPFAILL